MSILRSFEGFVLHDREVIVAYYNYMENPTEKSLKKLNECLLDSGTAINNMRNDIIVLQEESE